MDALIDEMAQKYKDDKKMDFDTAKSELMSKMSGADSKMHGTTVRLSTCRYYSSLTAGLPAGQTPVLFTHKRSNFWFFAPQG